MAYTLRVEGPTHVTPPTPPKPRAYYSCVNCIHYHTQRKMSTETRSGTNYHKVCHHPVMVANKTMSLDTNENIESDGKTVTPESCPYLKAKEDEQRN